jgi:excisionase family DNA binding protein
MRATEGDVRDEYFTPQEVARRLHRNEQTIRRYLRKGQLRGIRLGNRWLITDGDLQRFLWEHPSLSGLQPEVKPHG